MPGDPSCLLKRAAQEELDLRIHAAKVPVRPSLQGVKDRRIQSKRK
jgi:hypothetical protein